MTNVYFSISFVLFNFLKVFSVDIFKQFLKLIPKYFMFLMLLQMEFFTFFEFCCLYIKLIFKKHKTLRPTILLNSVISSDSCFVNSRLFT